MAGGTLLTIGELARLTGPTATEWLLTALGSSGVSAT
jgi:hypothetical protein